jgi:hypothetical protein
MKANQISMALAALALVVSVASLALRPQARKPSLPAAGISMSSPDAAALVERCDGSSPVASMADLMKSRVGPDLTRISFALHHDTRPASERLEDVASTAGHLMGCIEQVPALHPDVPVARLGEFYDVLDGMTENALAIQVSALELDEKGAFHWFTHLKQDCVTCHIRFRPTEVAAVQ